MSNFAPDYVDVAARIRTLREKHPESSLQGSYEVVTLGDSTYIVYRAECYRSAEDTRPGVGYAWEPVPGRTPYTKGSELMNAETSAWGRAIVAAGAGDAKRVASENEIRAARPTPGASPERLGRLIEEVKAANLGDWVKEQKYAWQWTDAVCDLIEKKLAEPMVEGA